MDNQSPWHEPRLISDLPKYDLPDGMRRSDSIMVYNVCDGCQMLWLMEWSPEAIHAQKSRTGCRVRQPGSRAHGAPRFQFRADRVRHVPEPLLRR